ncbi:hypothetical protein OH76DRAFT_260297 [Lentinus brumalis]|uniref:Uncharacterized protein n=1 Tax=Lentinus brumalis TaxID=2498619 RepID=A0A371DGH1_9APHY|nr:hypothetical protein OH76DRAFT_260297 [Polyporus brumalis]
MVQGRIMEVQIRICRRFPLRPSHSAHRLDPGLLPQQALIPSLKPAPRTPCGSSKLTSIVSSREWRYQTRCGASEPPPISSQVTRLPTCRYWTRSILGSSSCGHSLVRSVRPGVLWTRSLFATPSSLSQLPSQLRFRPPRILYALAENQEYGSMYPMPLAIISRRRSDVYPHLCRPSLYRQLNARNIFAVPPGHQHIAISTF